jgi:predicted secreted protein
MLVRKLLITSGITIVLFGVVYGVIETSGLSLRELSDRYRL